MIEGEDKKIQRIIQKQERYLIERISWISLCISILYVCGYTWRVVYYKTLGVPVSIIDFPFPEILVPQPGFLAFLFTFLYLFLLMQYIEFHRQYRIAQISKMLGTELPTDKIYEYLTKRNVKSGHIFKRKTNIEVFNETILRYSKDSSDGKCEKPFDVDGFKRELIKLFPDATEKMRRSILDYFIGLYSMSKEEMIQTVRFSSGIPAWIMHWSVLAFFLITFLPLSFMLHYYWRDIFVIPWMLGIVTASLLSLQYHSKNRFQLWFMIIITIVCAIIGTGISAKMTGNLDLTKKRFTIVTVLLADKKMESGFLLGRFSDRYVIMPLETADTGKRVSIQTSQVISMNLICPDWKTSSIKEDKIQKFLKDHGITKIK